MFLREIHFRNWPDTNKFPFGLPAFRGIETIDVSTFLTFFVGENGSGKSTLLEAVALLAGFNAEGGSRGNQFVTADTISPLHEHLKLSWLPKVTDGFFFRAESFFNFASHIDETAREPFGPANPYAPYGGRSLHEQSHGESFLNLFQLRLTARKPALYLLDEPEAALSPARQLALLRLLHDHERTGRSQFIIATHSPILLAYPNARIYTFDDGPLHRTRYQDTMHYAVTRRFLQDPESMLRELFGEG